MAARNRAIIATRWKTVANRNYPVALDDCPNGVTISDVVGQPDANIPPTPNVYFVEVEDLTNAQLTSLKALTAYFVLMDEQYDDVTKIVSSSTYDDLPTAPQMLAFKNTIQIRFPDVDDDKLTDAGQLILRAGLTRRQALQALIVRWQRFAKG